MRHLTHALAPPAGVRRLPRSETLVVAAVAALIAWLTVLPLAVLLWRTFVVDGNPTLEIVRSAYESHGLGPMLVSSAVFGAGSTFVALSLGTLLAYLVVRTDLPLKSIVVAGAVVPLAVPGVLYTIAWIFLAAPRSGSLNQLLGEGTLDVFSLPGMIAVEGFHLVPIAFLITAAALRALDPALEDAALASGARPLTVLRRITLPLARPALAAVALLLCIRALEAFEVPALLGIPSGTWVFTSRIWRALGETPADVGAAGAYSLPLLVLTALGIVLLARLDPGGRRFETMSGKAHRPHTLALGRWRTPLGGLALAVVAVMSALPLLSLVWVSTQPYFSPPSGEALGRASLASYGRILGDERTLHAIANSALLATLAATAIVALAAVASWLVFRTRVRGRRLLDGLTYIPLAVPGLVVGVALLVAYVRAPLPIYGTLWILLIAYMTRFLPYGMRSVSVPMRQVGRELEESARVSGASWGATFRRVLLPLLGPGLVAGWAAVAIVSLRELPSSLVLYAPGEEVLPVTFWELYEGGEFAELAALGVVTTIGLAVLAAVAYRVGVRARRQAR